MGRVVSVAGGGAPRYRLGVDVGGTFTDCVLAERTRGLVFDKAFSTPGNLAAGVVASIENACQQWGLPLGDVLPAVEVFKLGTTSPVNRLINRAGAPTALLTTRGHEDAVLIGRVQQKTDGLSDVERTDIRSWGKAEPLVARRVIYGEQERVDCFGEVVCSLSEPEVEHAVRDALGQGIRSFAVCFLWAFANPRHENTARRIIEDVAPDAFITLSSDVSPMIGEYERAATTILNSYLGPGTAEDLASLESVLREGGLRAPVFVMQSSGGVAPAREAVHHPVYLLGSGPVGGVAAARERSRSLPGGNVIATDMGGTSFDVGVVSRGRPIERRLSVHGRFKVLVSALEVTSVGAGGGSIASVDPVTGVLRVGPASAGSVPGPVCCGFGGTEPTVTDANAVLGRLNPDAFFAGRHRLDLDAARSAIEARLAKPLGASVEATATAVLRIVDSAMGDLIRKLTIERGFDPRDFAIVAYGGGGPLHVGSYARELGVRSAIIPRVAPVYSAWGIAESPALRSFSVSAPTLLPAQGSVIATVLGELGTRAANALGSRSEVISHARFVDMRYRYQQQELRVPVGEEELARGDLSEVLMSRFERLYEERFGSETTVRGAGIEISTFRHVVSEELGDGTERPISAPLVAARRSQRDVYFDGVETMVPVHDADAASSGFAVEGPCVVEGQLMTIVVHPGQSLSLGATDDFVLTLAGTAPGAIGGAQPA